MKITRIVGARGAVPVVVAGFLAASLFGSELAAQLSAVSSAPDPEISVITPPATRFINFVATPRSYVVLVRVSEIGTVDVLYPAIPSLDQARINSAARVQVPTIASTPKATSRSSVFAFVSTLPYDFSKVASTNGWNTLHLSSYGGMTDAMIARAFGSEIAGAAGRVIMSRATPGGTLTVNHSPGQPSASLASFKNKPCPYLSIPMGNADGTVSCMAKTISLPSQTTTAHQAMPMTSNR